MIPWTEIPAAGRTLNFNYAIRNIVGNAKMLEARGRRVRYLNIGDPLIYGFHTPPELIEAVRLSQYPEFERDDEQVIYDFAAELVYNRFIQERTYAGAFDLLGDGGVVELAGLVGYYSMVAMSLNAFQIPLPKGTKPTLVDCPTFR